MTVPICLLLVVYFATFLSSKRALWALTHIIFSPYTVIYMYVGDHTFKITRVLLLFHQDILTIFPKQGLRCILHKLITCSIPNLGFCQSFPSLASCSLNDLLRGGEHNKAVCKSQPMGGLSMRFTSLDLIALYCLIYKCVGEKKGKEPNARNMPLC